MRPADFTELTQRRPNRGLGLGIRVEGKIAECIASFNIILFLPIDVVIWINKL